MPGEVAIWPDVRPPADAPAETLLAGWWCPPETGPPLRPLPNPWTERSVIAEAERRVWHACQELVPLLAAVLGGEDEAWWRWVLAPWLVYVVSVVEDARVFLEAAAGAAPDAPVLVPGTAAPPPATMGESVSRLRSGTHHRVLVGDLARALGIPTGPAEASDTGADMPTDHHPRGLTPRERVSRLVLGAGGPGIAIVGLFNASPRQALELRARTGVRIRPPRAVALDPPPPDPVGRAALENAALPGSGLAALTSRLLVGLVPRSLLEGRAELTGAARRAYGRPAHLVVGNYGADEAMNVHMAESAKRGRRIDHAQHGGFYLQAPVNAQERLEIREGSTFLAWRDTPSPYLERIRGTHEGGSAAVIVEGLNPPDPFALRFASTPIADQGYESTRQLTELVGATTTTRQHLTLRRSPRAGAWRPAAVDALPQAEGASAVEALRRARIALVTYPDTPFIEAMVLGVPTIGLWDPRHWELRDDARPAFEALREAGVVFGDPRGAAAHLDEVYDRAGTWWSEPAVAAARAMFIERFAPSGDWLGAWTAHLRAMRSR